MTLRYRTLGNYPNERKEVLGTQAEILASTQPDDYFGVCEDTGALVKRVNGAWVEGGALSYSSVPTINVGPTVNVLGAGYYWSDIGGGGAGGYEKIGTAPWVGAAAPTTFTGSHQVLVGASRETAVLYQWDPLANWGGGYVLAGSSLVAPPEFPLIVAHRGGTNIGPQNTIELFRAAVAAGIRCIETDVQLLSDGSVGIMHDTSIDTTTTGTGNVADQTVMSWRNLKIDTSYTEWGTPSPPLLSDLLNEFGNKVLLLLELKDHTCCSAVLQCLEDFKIRKDFVVVTSFTQSDLLPAISAGWPTMLSIFATDPSAVAPAAVAAGVQWIGLQYSANIASYIAYCKGLGLRTSVWSTSGRKDSEDWISAGADAVTTDDPIYVAGTARKLTDPFALGGYSHGMVSTTKIRSSNGHDFGVTAVSGGKLVFTPTDTAFYGVRASWLNPLPESFVVEFWAKFDSTNETDTRWLSLLLQTEDNQPFSDSGVADSTHNGYLVILRKNGGIQLGSAVNGASTTIGVVEGTTIANGGTAHYRITKTPTTLTAERLDVATTVSASAPVRVRSAALGTKGIVGSVYSVTIDN